VQETLVSEGSLKQLIEVSRFRLLFVGAFLFLTFTAIVGRLFLLGVHAGDGKMTEAVPQVPGLQLDRGSIIDRNGVLLAANLHTKSLFANPRHVIDAKEAATRLHAMFPDESYEKLLEKLSSDRTFVWLKRRLSPKEQEKIMSWGQPGLYFKEEEKRAYPHGRLVSHILGFVGVDGKGLSGLERAFNKQLTGDFTKDKPIQLSIDVRVQDILHEELSSSIAFFNAVGGAGVVMDVNTGEILGMVSLPDFDPNNPSRINPENTFNRTTYGVYELGSAFKAFTIAQALDQDIVSLTDSYDATKPIKVGGFNIRDFHPEERWLTVPEIFVHSSNIGTARMAMDIGEKRQEYFFKQLGMLDPVDIEIPERGRPIYPERWGKISSMTISFGHGIAVSPMHLAQASAAMINGGKLFKPTLFKTDEVYFKKHPAQNIITPRTSSIMRQLYRLVVAEGTGGKAKVEGYEVGGKTGTAEKSKVGGYARKSMISSFVGAFPMSNPQYLVLAVLDEPQGNKSTWGYATGGFTAAPVVSKVISRMAPLLGVEPKMPAEQLEAIKKPLIKRTPAKRVVEQKAPEQKKAPLNTRQSRDPLVRKDVDRATF
jgi:cell division protein FtsI (penicillin-binding protein 3)